MTKEIAWRYAALAEQERDILLHERAALRAALKVARANLEAGTYTEAAKDIIDAALANLSPSY